MGGVKNLMMEYEARGYSDAPDKKVCAKMFPNQRYIRELIQMKGEYGVCDYCGKEDFVLSLQNVVEFVFDEFQKIFETPDNLPFESRGIWDELAGTGLHKECAGYILPDERSIMSTGEALFFAGFEPDDDNISDDISGCILEDAWVLKNPFELTDEETMSHNWEEFWKNTINATKEGKSYCSIRVENSYLLDYISASIASNIHSLKTVIRKGDRLYRCVNYKKIPQPLEAKHLWAPPAEKASSQRMSRDGQSRFYASFDSETPLREAVSDGSVQYHCLGEFELEEDIEILDFSNIPSPNILNVPDMFAYRFFYKFSYAITQQVGDDEKEKYVPTQLMRDIIEENFLRLGILGIKYRSVKGKNTTNVVLFVDDASCGKYLRLIFKKVLNNQGD